VAHQIVVMGVSGSGKSTLASRLAQALGGVFIEGDDHHSAESREKMRQGVGLSDSDREAWLDRLSTCIDASAGTSVLSCSALKLRYRTRLRGRLDRLRFVYLDIALPEATERVSNRLAHSFPASLVADQFAALEPPTDEAGVLCLPALQPVERHLDAVLAWLEAPVAAR
jgi:gluconokinase